MSVRKSEEIGKRKEKNFPFGIKRRKEVEEGQGQGQKEEEEKLKGKLSNCQFLIKCPCERHRKYSQVAIFSFFPPHIYVQYQPSSIRETWGVGGFSEKCHHNHSTNDLFFFFQFHDKDISDRFYSTSNGQLIFKDFFFFIPDAIFFLQ